MHSRVASIAAATLVLGCASALPERDVDDRPTMSAAREFYEAYEAEHETSRSTPTPP